MYVHNNNKQIKLTFDTPKNDGYFLFKVINLYKTVPIKLIVQGWHSFVSHHLNHYFTSDILKVWVSHDLENLHVPIM